MNNTRGRRTYKPLTLIIVTLLLFIGTVKMGCGLIDEPVAPSWRVTTVIPFLNATYSLEELLEKLEPGSFRVRPEGTIDYLFTRRFSNILSFRDSLQLGFTDVFESNLGNRLSIPSFSVQGGVSVSEIGTASSVTLPSGTNLSITQPLSGLQSPQLSFALDDTIDSVRVETGSIEVVLDNQTGFTLSSIQVELRDQLQNNTLLSTASLSTLTRGTQGTLNFSLNGRLFRRSLRVRITSMTIPAQTGVTSTGANRLNMTLRRGPVMTFTSARVRTEATAFNEIDTLSIARGNFDKVREAVISKGRFRISVENPFALTGTAVVTLPQLRLQDTPFSLTVPVQASRTTTVFSSSLNGWRLNPIGDTALQYQASISVNPSSGFIGLSRQMPLSVRVESDSLLLGSFTGTLWDRDANAPLQTVFTIEPVTITGLEKIIDARAQFQATGVFELRNQIGFGARAQPSIESRNSRLPNSLFLSRQGAPIDVSITPNGSATEVFTTSNSNINAFFLNLPDSVRIGGSAVLNPTRALGTITSESDVELSMDFTIPFDFALDTILVSDTISLSSVDLGGLQNARLELRLTNGIPLSLATRLLFLDEAKRPIIIDSIQARTPFVLPRNDSAWTIRAAGVNTAGISQGVTESQIQQTLTESEVNGIRRASFVRLLIDINTLQGGASRQIKLRNTDSVRLQATLRLTL